MSKQKVARSTAVMTNGELTSLLKQYGCVPSSLRAPKTRCMSGIYYLIMPSK
jgi:hypothetical protein